MAARKKDIGRYWIETDKIDIVKDEDGNDIKYCSVCKKYKPLHCFKINLAKYKGYNYFCSSCLEEDC